MRGGATAIASIHDNRNTGIILANVATTTGAGDGALNPQKVGRCRNSENPAISIAKIMPPSAVILLFFSPKPLAVRRKHGAALLFIGGGRG